MSLRKKTLLITGLIFLSMMIILYAISHTVLLTSFETLEEQNARRDVAQALAALRDRLEDIKSQLSDWAPWDDTYDFIEDGNQAYIRSNLVDDTFSGQDLNVMIFINSSGRVIYSKYYNLDARQQQPLPTSILKQLDDHKELWRLTSQDTTLAGILMLPENPMLIACAPILTSNHAGPSRGTLIFGRHLDHKVVDDLSSITQLSVTLSKLQSPAPVLELQSPQAASLPGADVRLQALNDHVLTARSYLKDIFGQPAL